MTIKQNGGIFGRNPEFNDVSAKDVSVTDEITILENGVDVGGVRSLSGQAQLSGTTTGITFGTQSVLPTNGGSAIQNGTRDIGGASNFWRNVYVTTGVYFGSQTIATHLDDYEEGEHTAVITATTSGTITLDSTNNKLAYTKVGRVVHVQGTIVVDSVSSPVGVAKITLPFTVSNSLSGLAERSPPSIWIQGSVSKNTTDFIGYVAEGSNQISVGTGDSTNFLSLGANELQAASSIYISVTYTAS